MNKKYLPNKSGYLVVLREIQGLLTIEGVNFSDIGAYLCFICQADWDNRHKDYKVILPTDKELSTFWGCNVSTVYRNRKRLTKLGLLEENGGNTYVKNLNMFNISTVKSIIKEKITDVHLYYARSERDLDDVLFGYA